MKQEGAWTKDVAVIASSHPPVERSGHRHVARGGSHAWLACCRRAAITWLWGLGQWFLSSLSFIRTALSFRVVVRIRGKYVLD